VEQHLKETRPVQYRADLIDLAGGQLVERAVAVMVLLQECTAVLFPRW
jgi:hypothetical protein